MIDFRKFITEQKNVHLEHVEDLIFNEGVVGARKAINFLRDLRDMLAGHTSKKISATVKWDGAPAIFVGIDPSDGKFFVAKKGVFNKNPKVYKTPADVRADTSGDLQSKLLIALSEFSKLGIKSGVYQGDLMFTSGDVRTETIDGESYYTFQPNTIVYAVPKSSMLGKKISKAKIGVVWHTTYTGKSFESMSASFGKGIHHKLNQPATVWQDDATYRDVSGSATMTKAETEQVTEILSRAGTLFQSIKADMLNDFSADEEFLLRVKTFINSHIRAGQIINPQQSAVGLMNYIHDYYQKEIDSRKTDASRKKQEEKRKNMMKFFTRHSKAEIASAFELMNIIAEAKSIIINKMNAASSIGTFLRTKSGLKATNQEGFVAIDHLTNGAVKIVDRLEFSRANFSSDIIKGWQR